MTIALVNTNALEDAISKLTKSLENFSQQQKIVTKQTKEAEKVEKALNKELVTREEVLTKAFDKLKQGGQELKKFEIFSKKSFDAYREAGGNAFDYLDLALSSMNQRVKILGVEAGLARKIMYGFLPPGMFRLVNKLSTSFRFLGGVFRKTGEEGENIDNIFKKTMRGLISFPKIMKMTGEDFGKVFGNINDKMLGKGLPKQMVKSSTEKIKSQKQKLAQVKSDAKSQFFRGNISASERDKLIQREVKKLKDLEKVKRKYMEKTPIYQFFKGVYKLPKTIVSFFSTALSFMKNAIIYLTLFLTIAYILWKTVGKTLIESIKEAWPAIKSVALIALGGLMIVWEGIQKIFHGFFGKNGSLADVIDGVLVIGLGILQFALGVAGTLLVALGGFVVEFIGIGIQKLVSFIGNAFTNTEKFLKALPILLLMIGGVIAFFMGAPVWIAATIGLVLYRVAAWTIKKFASIIPPFASGGVSSGGLAIVGEKGPELVSLPRGSRVNSNKDSQKMLSQGNGTVNNFNITINAKDTSKAEMRRMADEIGRMVSSSINRSTSSSNLR